MTFQFSSTQELRQDVSIIPVAANEQLEEVLQQLALATGLSATTLSQDFKAEFCEILPLYNKNQRLFLLGLGKKKAAAELVRAFRTLTYRQRERLPEKIAINLFFCKGPLSLELLVETAVNGIWLGGYQIGKFRSERQEPINLWDSGSELSFQVPESAVENAATAAAKGMAMALTQCSVMDLVNAPSNKKIPSDLANWALRSGEQYGYRVDVFDLNRIRTIGLHALLAVGQGSEVPPSFIVMEYVPKDHQDGLPRIGLVGKGVTFDTGGLSIKPSANLHYMKSDMGGAAAVFGAMEMAAKLQLPVHLIGIVPSTENSVDGRSVKPGDVIDSYSGKTIEVIDTDAEGRLILADGIAYILRHYEPEVLIDLATLTGSTVRTLGYYAAAVFANNEELNEQLCAVAESTGERLWRFPLWDVYKEDIKSDVADVRNYSGRPLAGAIGAAKFLEFFIEDHPAWAHLDIAGVAFTDSEFSIQKSATAYGVRLLTEYLIARGKRTTPD